MCGHYYINDRVFALEVIVLLARLNICNLDPALTSPFKNKPQAAIHYINRTLQMNGFSGLQRQISQQQQVPYMWMLIRMLTC